MQCSTISSKFQGKMCEFCVPFHIMTEKYELLRFDLHVERKIHTGLISSINPGFIDSDLVVLNFQVMVDSLCSENVCSFYHEALIYGQNVVEEAALKWLESNLMLQTKNFSLLCDIDPPLMAKILNSPDLFVLQVEMDIYTMLKKWLYMRMTTYDERLLIQSKTDREASAIVRNFFRELHSKNSVSYLETEQGMPFNSAFQAVRFCNILRDFSCCLEVNLIRLIFIVVTVQ